jgi:hypothetical protein
MYLVELVVELVPQLVVELVVGLVALGKQYLRRHSCQK